MKDYTLHSAPSARGAAASAQGSDEPSQSRKVRWTEVAKQGSKPRGAEPWGESVRPPREPAALQTPSAEPMTRGLVVPTPRDRTARAPDGKLFAVAFVRTSPQAEAKAKVVGIATDASKYSVIDPRRVVFKEGLKVAAEAVADLAAPGKLRVRIKDYTAYAQADDGLVAVALADAHYPSRAGAAVVRDAMQDFLRQGDAAGNAVASEALKRSSDPRNADRLVNLQMRVEEVKEVFLDALHASFERGEKLDNLAADVEALGLNARKFKKTAQEVKRSFQCCKIM